MTTARKKIVGATTTLENIKPKEVYCELCRIACYKKDAQDHMHSLAHHRELDAVLGKDSCHECHACKEAFRGLSPYSQHISTEKHQAQMVSIKSRNEKPRSLYKVLGMKLMTEILERNKREKKSKKKKSKKKKISQLASSKTSGIKSVVVKDKQNNCSRQSWTHAYSQAQSSKSADQLKTSVKGQNPKRDTGYRRRHMSRAYPTHVPRQILWSAVKQHGCCSKSCSTAASFTSDHLPQTGVIIFDHALETSTVKRQASRRSSSPASAEKITNVTTPHYISKMLRRIRRELGVREPCRADREARKQSAEMADAKTPQLAGGEQGAPPVASGASLAVQAAPVGSHVLHPESGAEPSSIAPAEKSAAFKLSQEGPATSGVKTSGPPDSKCAPSDPDANVCTRVRIAHKPKEGLEAKKATSKSSWTDVKRKRPEEGTGIPRCANDEPEQDSSTQMEEVPLSAGFHWESIPDSPSFAALTALPPPVQHTPQSDSLTEPQSSPLMPEASEELPARGDNGRQAAAVKVEPHPAEENGAVADQSSAKTRKNTTMTQGQVSDEEPHKKKVRRETDRDQMDQLLVVSLREENLNSSLENLDRSLLQARNILQAAYAELQRLLLLRQQYAADINSLRAKRIEILQGMQGESSVPRESLMAKDERSSAVASGLQPPRAHPTPSTSQPHPSSLTLPDRVGQTPQLLSNSDPQVEQLVGQPLPMFPPNLIPPLLLPAPPSLNPAPLASFLQKATPHGSVSVSEATRKSSVPEQEQLKVEEEEGLTDCDKTAMSNIRPTVEKPIPMNVSEKDQKSPASVATEHSDGKESAASAEVAEPPNQKVINVDESDREEPIVIEAPQASVSTAATQNEERKRKAPLVTAIPPEVQEEELSLGAFKNHQSPIHGLEIYQGRLYTCSRDQMARAYSLRNRDCQAVFTGHTNKINCLLVSPAFNMLPCLFTGSSDKTIRCYSIKTQNCVEMFCLSERILCLHSAWDVLFAGLGCGSVAIFDLKTLKQLEGFEFPGPRKVRCLDTAEEGDLRMLLVGSLQGTINLWDIRNYLLLRTLEGLTENVLCMKVANDLVFSGSNDTSVYAHNIHTGNLVHTYKGNSQGVMAVVILGNVIMTACVDKLIRVYDLKSHDCLQVYGGYSDVVMCMTVYKGVIYTGCNDGSVQAVKMDLTKNFHCRWQDCSLIFGIKEHLMQHLLRDHTNPCDDVQEVRCRWRSCTAFFAEQHSVKQELPEHMRSHVENDTGATL